MSDPNGTPAPSYEELAGIVLANDTRLDKIAAHVARIPVLEEKVDRALAHLGIKSDAPPATPIREELASLRETDALTTAQMKALTQEQADLTVRQKEIDTRIKRSQTIIQALGGVKKAILKLAAAIALASAAAGGLLGFGREIWAAIHGH